MNIELNEEDSKALLSLLDLCIEADRPQTAFYLDYASVKRVEELKEKISEQGTEEVRA